MRISLPLILLPLLAACNPGEGSSERAAQSGPSGLAGLYEGAATDEEGNRLCMTSRGERQARFAFVSLGEGRAACSGSGMAMREGEALRLVLAGDGECEIAARMEDGRIALPAQVPEGCEYYCSDDANLAALEFERVDGGMEAARRARDLVGDQLCR